MPDVSDQRRSAHGHEHLLTSCGRELTVGGLDLGDARRVFIDIGGRPGCNGTNWASLTVAEARLVGRALLAEAAAAEPDAVRENQPAARACDQHRTRQLTVPARPPHGFGE